MRIAAYANAGWMTFVWVQRIRNAVANDEPNPTGAYVMSGAMLAGAAVLVVAATTSPGSATTRALTRIVPAAHGALWVVRGTQIAMSDRSVPFIAVHEVLAAASIGLAVWAWRAATSTESPAGPEVGAGRGRAATI
jgi:hypothetical protein